MPILCVSVELAVEMPNPWPSTQLQAATELVKLVESMAEGAEQKIGLTLLGMNMEVNATMAEWVTRKQWDKIATSKR